MTALKGGHLFVPLTKVAPQHCPSDVNIGFFSIKQIIHPQNDNM